jgi:hypothetical protein
VQVLAALLVPAAWLAAGAVWLVTTVSLWTSGETFLSLLAFFPPADILLAFMVNTTLGLVGLGAIGAYFVAGALSAAADRAG